VHVRHPSAQEATGQHFLRSKQLAAELVAEAGVSRGDLIVEIGGGTGVLTQALVKAGATIAVVERDHVLAAQLRARFRRLDTVVVTQGDAAEYEWPARTFSVVANLPFARSGVILSQLLKSPLTPLRRAHVIVQWEFAVKHASVCPGTLRATYWRAWYDVSIARRLAPIAFSPPPRVPAAVLCIERRGRPRVPVECHEAYWDFLSAAFASGKSIRGCLGRLSALEVKRLAPAVGFMPHARPRDLDATQWSRLFERAQVRR